MDLNSFYESKIKSHGLALVGVMPGVNDEPAPPFTYTIGLWPVLGFGFELIAIGLKCNVAGQMFNYMYAKNKASKLRFKFGVDDTRWTVDKMPCRFYACDDFEAVHDKYVIQADAYWGTRVPVVQMVVPDSQGRFFDNPEYDWDLMAKPQPFLFLEGQAHHATWQLQDS